MSKDIKKRRRIRSKISGTTKRPRISVFRSNKYIYAQLIDDVKRITLASANEKEIKAVKSDKKKTLLKTQKQAEISEKRNSGHSKIDKAFQVGLLLSKKAKTKKISSAVFDRSGYKYHGRVKTLADGAREGGLKF
ncbi:hypothetical protein A2Z22_02235 [Candidatus Woesebacteria bacterium RBG_16_34_12]|uniref:Large ribosomal subunit protein uL18 n=1 Tax=Candidatus Woesebacteria bacterium RBG_16_34_12 TaxID=1802480 RepID=A0A1F7X978_9BACT|nr:MAG: hypothetical protein A2Z22_02235 [Candidatus Woesebacteria bacterium RBG_16_34_12]